MHCNEKKKNRTVASCKGMMRLILFFLLLLRPTYVLESPSQLCKRSMLRADRGKDIKRVGVFKDRYVQSRT